MIRPFTCLCMLLAAGAGLYLYQEKHRAQVLDREIMRVVKATDVARERTGMLRAEWALLNEPDRLAALAERHLSLKPLTPGQFVPLTELANRLPAPIIPGLPVPGLPVPDSPVIAMDDAAPLAPTPLATTPLATTKVPVVQEPAPVPLPTLPPAAPVRVAVAVKPPNPVATIQIIAPAKPPRPVRSRPSELGDTLATALPPPKPIYAPVLRAVATSALANSATPAMHAPTAQRVEAGVPQPAVGSSLGMARTTLPPPVPVAVASALEPIPSR